jgi:hypothetical protein
MLNAPSSAVRSAVQNRSRVGAVAVGVFEAGVDPPELGCQCCDPRHRAVDVQPQAFAVSDFGDVNGGIERHRAGRAVRRAHPERCEARGAIRGDHLGKCGWSHCEGFVVRNRVQPSSTDAGDAKTLFDAGVRL